MATLYIAIQLSSLRRLYAREARVVQMERTLRAVQLPTSVAKTMDDVLYLHTNKDLDFEKDKELAASVREALSFFETLATGILSEVYDEEIAYSRLSDSLTRFYGIASQVVYQSRSRNLSANLWVKTEQLVRRWISREQSPERYRRISSLQETLR
jgi:hypothetical protein